jgi:hypothetical protein
VGTQFTEITRFGLHVGRPLSRSLTVADQPLALTVADQTRPCTLD